MSNKQFLAIIGITIVLLLGALGLEHHRTCQEKGGIYCLVGPNLMGTRMLAH